MLVGEGRYNAAKSLGPLEAYAQQQVKEGSYDLDANLALLKVRIVACAPLRRHALSPSHGVLFPWLCGSC